jgi:hypothetical protein
MCQGCSVGLAVKSFEAQNHDKYEIPAAILQSLGNSIIAVPDFIEATSSKRTTASILRVTRGGVEVSSAFVGCVAIWKGSHWLVKTECALVGGAFALGKQFHLQLSEYEG